MRTHHPLLLLACAALAACNPDPGSTVKPKPVATATATPEPFVQATATPAPHVFSGRVLGLDGAPAANVAVSAYGSTDPAASGPVGVTTTDADGHFDLSPHPGQQLTVEAVQSATVKAIQQGVDLAAGALTLQLAATGAIHGKVTAPAAPNVKDFAGVQVFIPGTPYGATADTGGSYAIEGLPAGSFTLEASKGELGRASVSNVAVAAKNTTSAPDLALSLALPTLASVSPPTASPGTLLTIKGSNFGEHPAVTIAGLPCDAPQQPDAGTLVVKVPDGVKGAGDVVVTVAGVASNALHLGVLAKLTLQATYHDLALGATRTFHAVGEDGGGTAFPDPGGVWSATGSVAVDGQGLVTAKAAGTGTVTLTVGLVTATASLTVHAEPFITTVAGDGANTAGYADGILSRFSSPRGLAAGADGTLYVADTGNNCIRAVSPDGLASTFCGTTTAGLSNGPAASARFNAPQGIAIDNAGTLYVADTKNQLLRKLTAGGDAATLAGPGTAGGSFPIGGNVTTAGLAFGAPGAVATRGTTVYVADPQAPYTGVTTALYAIAATGGFKAITSGLGGLVYRALEVNPLELASPNGLAVAPDGTVYVLEGDSAVIAYGPPTFAPRVALEAPKIAAIATDASGTLYWIGQGPKGSPATASLYSLTTAGKQGGGTVPVGSGTADGAFATAALKDPKALVVLPSGDFLVLDAGTQSVREVVTPH